MSDPRVEKLAQLLVDYSVAVRKGDRVVINGNTLAKPLLKEIYIRVLKAGGHPLMMASLPDMEELFSVMLLKNNSSMFPSPLS